MLDQASVEDIFPQVLQQTFEPTQTTVPNQAECCIICLGDLAEQCETIPCRHNTFDFLCLITWLEQNPTCPLCKAAVGEVRYDLDNHDKVGKVYMVPQRPESSKQTGQGSSLRSIRRRIDAYDASTVTQSPYEFGPIQRRRFIYQHNLYSFHVGSNTRQAEESRYRELSPQLITTDPELVRLARLWLRRELRVFLFLNMPNQSPDEIGISSRITCSQSGYLLEYIVAILKHVDMQDSTGQAENLIQKFLGRKNTRLLLHELRNWLRSPCTSLGMWDRSVQYAQHVPESAISQSETTGLAAVSDITLKYHEPEEARKSSPVQAWQLYVFRGDEIVEVVELWERSVWLFGREERVVDIATLHPSCSNQHAVLQFRWIPNAPVASFQAGAAQESGKGSVRPFLFDLGSKHGTILNGKRIESREYVSIEHKDVIQFGGSTREYVVILPPN